MVKPFVEMKIYTNFIQPLFVKPFQRKVKVPEATPAIAEKTYTYYVIVKKSTLENEVKGAFRQLKELLGKDGLGLQNIAKMEIELSGLGGRFVEFNKLYAAELGGHLPARVCVEPSMREGESIIITATASASPVEIVKAGPEGAPYSTAVRAGNMLYISGQIFLGTPDEPKPDMDRQIIMVLNNMRAIAKEANVDLKQATDLHVYVNKNLERTTYSPLMLLDMFGKKTSTTMFTKELPGNAGFELACNVRIG